MRKPNLTRGIPANRKNIHLLTIHTEGKRAEQMRKREREGSHHHPGTMATELDGQASRANSPSIPVFLLVRSCGDGVETTPAPPLSTRTPESPHGRPPASFSARWEAAAEEEQEAATAPGGGAAWLRPRPSLDERGGWGDGESQRGPPGRCCWCAAPCPRPPSRRELWARR